MLNFREKKDNKDQDKGQGHYLMHRCMGHTAWAPVGHEGRSQAGQKPALRAANKKSGPLDF